MIEIIRDSKSDSRVVNGELDIDKLFQATLRHMREVQDGLGYFADLLDRAGECHDYTKLTKLEDYHAALTSGTIKQSDWFRYHITEERHHPLQYLKQDINLLDVLEYLTDCVMAGSVRGNVHEIKLPDELLQKAFANTVELLKRQVVVTEVEE